MLPRFVLRSAPLLCVLAFTAAAESDAPSFVEATLELLANSDVGQLTSNWPTEDGEPEVCEPLYRSLTPWQNGASDINRFALLADLERSILWVELARGIDDMRFYRGPVRLNDRAGFEYVDPESLPSCAESQPPDAA
jgi:hypothetical protein